MKLSEGNIFRGIFRISALKLFFGYSFCNEPRSVYLIITRLCIDNNTEILNYEQNYVFNSILLLNNTNYNREYYVVFSQCDIIHFVI